MKNYEGNHFSFYYEEEDSDFMRSAIDVAEGSYDEITKEFEIEPERELFEVFICPDVRSYIKNTDKTEESYESWMVGNADYEKRRLCILSPRVSGRSVEEMLSIVRHEVVHIVFDKVAAKSPDDISPLIAEGGAVYLAEQINLDHIDRNSRPDVMKLSDEDYFYDNDGYNYSGVYIGYIIRKYGREAYRNIYSEKEPLEKYVYPGFEEDAIESFMKCQG